VGEGIMLTAIILNRRDKLILLAALQHWSFKRHAVEAIETSYIDKEAYQDLVERIEEELKK